MSCLVHSGRGTQSSKSMLLWETISPLKELLNSGSPGVHHPFAEMTFMWQMVQIAWHALWLLDHYKNQTCQMAGVSPGRSIGPTDWWEELKLPKIKIIAFKTWLLPCWVRFLLSRKYLVPWLHLTAPRSLLPASSVSQPSNGHLSSSYCSQWEVPLVREVALKLGMSPALPAEDATQGNMFHTSSSAAPVQAHGTEQDSCPTVPQENHHRERVTPSALHLDINSQQKPV